MILSSLTRSERQAALTLAALKFLVHVLTNTIYTFHRDEFLYIDEGNHPAWGYLEVPPLTPLLGKAVTLIAGNSLFGIRLLPAMVAALTMLLIARIVKELGGSIHAMVIAGIAFLMSPAFLRTGTLFQPVCLDQLWWVITILLTLLISKYGRSRDYLLLGIACGLAWLTKYSIACLIIALFGGVLLSRARGTLLRKETLWAVGIAMLIALPNLVWQFFHRFPVIHHMQELAESQLVHVEAKDFLAGQLIMQGAGSLIWIAGLIWLFRSQAGQPYRFIGYTFAFVLGLLLILSGKAYYTLGIYPVLFAAGGTAIEQWSVNHKWTRHVAAGFVILLNLPLIPLGLPLLRDAALVRYCSALSRIGIDQRWENGKTYPIPQDYADMRGWEEIPRHVAQAYYALPEEKRKTCLIYGGSYVHAGAINYYRHKYQLPEAYSMHASYVLWIPDNLHFDNLILVDDTWQDSSALFHFTTFIDSTTTPLARDPGYVFYQSEPITNVDSVVYLMIQERKQTFRR